MCALSDQRLAQQQSLVLLSLLNMTSISTTPMFGLPTPINGDDGVAICDVEIPPHWDNKWPGWGLLEPLFQILFKVLCLVAFGRTSLSERWSHIAKVNVNEEEFRDHQHRLVKRLQSVTIVVSDM